MAASKAKTTQPTRVETATKAVADAAVKAQDQYFSVLEQSQDAVLERFTSLVENINKVEMPAVPGMDKMTEMTDKVTDRIAPNFELKMPAVSEDAFDGVFNFGAKLIENQRTFTRKILAASTKA
jgi:hypothetical protein